MWLRTIHGPPSIIKQTICNDNKNNIHGICRRDKMSRNLNLDILKMIHYYMLTRKNHSSQKFDLRGP